MNKSRCCLMFTVVGLAVLSSLPAQTSPPVPATTVVVTPVARTNTAIIAVQRPEPGARRRTELVLQRAKDNPGACDVVFIGDSITEQWERPGSNVWKKYYGNLKTLNFGVGGDRTQHVLWRFEQGQLDGLKPKVAVVMIGTNNSNRDDNTEGDILAGVKAILKGIRDRCPETRIVLVAIFPRGRTFSVQRGKILQVNQALAKLDDGATLRYVDFGSKLIEPDGSISPEMMGDALHLRERGYQIWAEALEPVLKEWLGGK